MGEIFIAGIIQGSDRGKGIYDQGYRKRLKSILQKVFPDMSIYCPFEEHPESVNYDDSYGREVFFSHLERSAKADLLVVYLPEASMGSAIEIWCAYQAGKPIITISPMKENWVIKFLSTRNFETIEEFEKFVESGEIKGILRAGKM